MLEKEGQPFTTSMTYFEDQIDTNRNEARIYVPIVLGILEDFAMVDTGAPWCVVKRELAENAGFDLNGQEVTVSTRLGSCDGTLIRVIIKIPACEGDALEVQAEMFVPKQDWPAPNFLGYLGLLQHIRFAVNARTNEFHFGVEAESY